MIVFRISLCISAFCFDRGTEVAGEYLFDILILILFAFITENSSLGGSSPYGFDFSVFGRKRAWDLRISSFVN